jgi:D-arabinose 1-dehydrogenase-like Zn-dependent alcohol dehydrogenase
MERLLLNGYRENNIYENIYAKNPMIIGHEFYGELLKLGLKN